MKEGKERDGRKHPPSPEAYFCLWPWENAAFSGHWKPTNNVSLFAEFMQVFRQNYEFA